MKRTGFVATVAGVAALLCACSLLPAEEEYRKVPVFVNYEAEEYTYVTVKQGNLQTKKMISAICVPANEASYSFGVSRIAYDSVYFQKGDAVKAGDLLAKLDMGDIEEDIKECERSLVLTRARQDYISGMIEVNSRLRMIDNGESEAAAREAATAEFRLESMRLANTEELLELKLTELSEEREKRVIYSEIDGVVSYIVDYEDKTTSNRNQPFITISDSTTAFLAETTEWMYLPEGDEVSMLINGNNYTGVVTGLADGVNGKMNVTIEMPPGSPESFAQGTRATVTVITAERVNVLYLPKMVVTTAGRDSIVYVEEDGIRKLKKVVTGFETDSQIEILSGLSQGDLVLKE